jgi:hypothetical protein
VLDSVNVNQKASLDAQVVVDKTTSTCLLV